MTRVTTYRDVAAVLRSPHARQELHRSSEVSAEFGKLPTDALVADSVLALDGDEHFRRRRLESALFTSAMRTTLELEVVLPTMSDALNDQVTSVDCGRADLMSLSRLILIRMSAAVLGLAPVNDIETADRLRILAERILHAIAVDWSTGDQDSVTLDGLEASSQFRRRFFADARRSFEDPEVRARERLNLISLLLDNPGSVSSEEVLYRETVLYLIASLTTTTNALPHAILELERWFDIYPSERTGLSSFSFCRRAANETLRLHPPVPGLLRQLEAPLALPSGRELSKDEFVFLDLRASARDRAVYGDDAAKFNPNRIVDPGVWPFGHTFGGGAHMCLGRTLAVGDGQGGEDRREAQGVLVRLLHEFYRWGIRRDPQHDPRHREATERDEYEWFPVIFSGRPDDDASLS